MVIGLAGGSTFPSWPGTFWTFWCLHMKRKNQKKRKKRAFFSHLFSKKNQDISTISPIFSDSAGPEKFPHRLQVRGCRRGPAPWTVFCWVCTHLVCGPPPRVQLGGGAGAGQQGGPAEARRVGAAGHPAQAPDPRWWGGASCCLSCTVHPSPR